MPLLSTSVSDSGFETLHAIPKLTDLAAKVVDVVIKGGGGRTVTRLAPQILRRSAPEVGPPGGLIAHASKLLIGPRYRYRSLETRRYRALVSEVEARYVNPFYLQMMGLNAPSYAEEYVPLVRRASPDLSSRS